MWNFTDCHKNYYFSPRFITVLQEHTFPKSPHQTASSFCISRIHFRYLHREAKKRQNNIFLYLKQSLLLFYLHWECLEGKQSHHDPFFYHVLPWVYSNDLAERATYGFQSRVTSVVSLNTHLPQQQAFLVAIAMNMPCTFSVGLWIFLEHTIADTTGTKWDWNQFISLQVWW